MCGKLVIFVFLLNCGSSEAFLDALASKIIDGIKSAFLGLFRAIGNFFLGLM